MSERVSVGNEAEARPRDILTVCDEAFSRAFNLHMEREMSRSDTGFDDRFARDYGTGIEGESAEEQRRVYMHERQDEQHVKLTIPGVPMAIELHRPTNPYEPRTFSYRIIRLDLRPPEEAPLHPPRLAIAQDDPCNVYPEHCAGSSIDRAPIVHSDYEEILRMIETGVPVLMQPGISGGF